MIPILGQPITVINRFTVITAWCNCSNDASNRSILTIPEGSVVLCPLCGTGFHFVGLDEQGKINLGVQRKVQHETPPPSDHRLITTGI